MTEQWMNDDDISWPDLTTSPIPTYLVVGSGTGHVDPKPNKVIEFTQFVNGIPAQPAPGTLHELRVARDGILTYCPCGWAFTFGYVPSGEDVSFVYRAHLEDLR